MGEDDEGSGRCRVFARARPVASAEGAAHGGAVGVQTATDANTVRVLLDGSEASAEAKDFVFDGVFPGCASQEDVFTEVGLPVLEECLRGFNSTVLAYGQTGSGKTHSLLHRGRANLGHRDAGILPRLIGELFDRIAADAESEYEISAAAMQVYNEHVDDLLHREHQSGGGLNLEVRSGGDVPGLTWTRCKKAESLKKAFNRARTNLVYAETQMNKASSRSHAVFQIRITRRTGPGRCTVARLSVVDLAGSERVKKSGVEGVQFKEATAINKSLLALGNVVSALAAKSAHVPFRDSKLTRILDGSIGGNCKTVLLVCVSSSMEHGHETLSSLEFASRAMHIEVNAKVNTVLEFDAEPTPEEPVPCEEVVSLEEQVAEALERAARAEARAEKAERDASEWEERARAAEAALEVARSEAEARVAKAEEAAAAEKKKAADAIARLHDRADEAEAERGALAERLAKSASEVESGASAVEAARAELDSARSEAARREADLLSRLVQAGEASQKAIEAAESLAQAEVEAEKARQDARAREEAAEAKEAAAADREAASATEGARLAAERAALQAEFEATLEGERGRLEARLKASQESFEARLADAKRRGEAELTRRMELVEGREEDARKISEQQAKLEEQRAELCKLIREVEALRRGGRSCAAASTAAHSSCGASTTAMPTLLGSQRRQGRAKSLNSRSNSELGHIPMALHRNLSVGEKRLSLAGASTLRPSQPTSSTGGRPAAAVTVAAPQKIGADDADEAQCRGLCAATLLPPRPASNFSSRSTTPTGGLSSAAISARSSSTASIAPSMLSVR